MLPSHWFLPEMLMNRENPVIWLDKRHTWPHSTKEILSDTTCLDEHPLAKDLRHSIIPSRDSDDHRILKSDWTRGTTAHIQLKLALPNVAFSHYFHIKNLRYWFFLGIWPGNPANWNTWPHTTKKILSGTTYLDENVLAKYVRYQLIPFRGTDDQRILHYDLTRSTPGHIQMKKLVLDATIPWWLSSCKKNWDISKNYAI